MATQADRPLAGQVAVVTGAGAGIGGAIARRLAEQGAHTIVTDLDGAAAAAVALQITAAGGRASSGVLNVLDLAAAEALVRRSAAEHGRIDIWCNNAGVSTMGRVVDLTERDWDFNMDVNAKGVFLCTKAIVPQMIAQGGGRIINTASMAGLRATPILAHYAASKWAVIGFTKSVAVEVAPHGITCNCVCPGFVRTDMQEREVLWEAEIRGMSPDEIRQEYIKLTPLGRLQEADDVADAVAYFAGPAGRFLTGVALPTTGGADLL